MVKRSKPLQFSLQVLVAEDNSINQTLLQKMLSRFGCTVALANDGEAAVRQALETPFDVIFMDVNMPNMNGEVPLARVVDLGCFL